MWKGGVYPRNSNPAANSRLRTEPTLCSQPCSCSPMFITWSKTAVCQIHHRETAERQLCATLTSTPQAVILQALLSYRDKSKVNLWNIQNVTEPTEALREHSYWVWRGNTTAVTISSISSQPPCTSPYSSLATYWTTVASTTKRSITTVRRIRRPCRIMSSFPIRSRMAGY